MTYRCYVGESLRAVTHTDVRLPDLLEPDTAEPDPRSTEEVVNDIIDGMAAILEV